MGACYSKSATGAALSQDQRRKAPGIRKRLSWRSKRREYGIASATEEAEKPTKQDQDFVEAYSAKTSFSLAEPSGSASRSSTPELLVQDRILRRVDGKGSDQPRVAPSDSGIESIGGGTVPDDGHDLLPPAIISPSAVSSSSSVNETNSAAWSDVTLRRQAGDGADSADCSGDDAERGCASGADRLSRRLERLSRGSCHKCGNFRLDDSAITALLADTYCLCGPRRAGQPSVNPQCQTHGELGRRSRSSKASTSDTNTDTLHTSQVEVTDALQNSQFEVTANGVMESSSSGFNFYPAGVNNSQCENKPRKSNLKQGVSSSGEVGSKNGKTVQMSLEENDLSRSSRVNETALGTSGELDDVFEENISSQLNTPLMLQHKSDSIDNSFNFSLPLSPRRRSLLSEILDITDSICRCDFYSNDASCPAAAAAAISDGPKHGQEFAKVCKSSQSNRPKHQQEDSNICKSAQNIFQTSAKQTQRQSSSSSMRSTSSARRVLSTSSPVLSSPARKIHVTPKVVSFEEDSMLAHPAACESPSPSPCHESRFGSGTQLGSSGSIPNGRERPSSQTSSEGVLLSGLVSDDDGGENSEDDTKHDVIHQSLVTSVQQLMESTDELAEPMSAARRMFIDGVDSVIIPTSIYRQMEIDIKLLKEQLQCLNLIIIEEEEEAGEESEISMTGNDTEMSFISA